MSDGMGRELAYLSSHATNRYFIPNWGNTSFHETNFFCIVPYLLSHFSMYIRDLGPTNRDAPRHLTEKSITRNLTSHAWLSCILKDLRAQPTHS